MIGEYFSPHAFLAEGDLLDIAFSYPAYKLERLLNLGKKTGLAHDRKKLKVYQDDPDTNRATNDDEISSEDQPRDAQTKVDSSQNISFFFREKSLDEDTLVSGMHAGLDVAEETKAELPLWLSRLLYLQDYISLLGQLPLIHLDKQIHERLKADADAVDLNFISEYFYESGFLMGGMYRQRIQLNDMYIYKAEQQLENRSKTPSQAQVDVSGIPEFETNDDRDQFINANIFEKEDAMEKCRLLYKILEPCFTDRFRKLVLLDFVDIISFKDTRPSELAAFNKRSARRHANPNVAKTRAVLKKLCVQEKQMVASRTSAYEAFKRWRSASPDTSTTISTLSGALSI